ncbi:MAG: sugar ABC transporter substrate-binding protein [Treponema sp.]|jgi:ABC-type glycerol-3-phosphate transport system substrate-binding protein|nr:sugar ABC transporter substrate-binding protein [Treponema sp.]
MKKLFVLLLGGLLFITITSSCGKRSAESGGESSKVVEVQFFHTTWVPAMLEILDDAVKQFEDANPGIKIVQTRTNWADAPSQLMASIMGGTPPDLIMANPGMLAQYRNIGAFADLTGWISQDFLKNLLPSSIDIITTPDGKIDGMPQEGTTYTLFYRKDLFEKAGLDPNKPPATWEELVETGKKLVKDTDEDGIIDQYAYGWPITAENASNYWINFMFMAGSEVSTFENNKWISKLDGPEALQGTQFMVDLIQTHKITPPNAVEYDWEGLTNAFVSGEVAMMHNGAWVVASVKQKGPELEGKWGTTVLFAGPGGPAYRGRPNTFHIMEASHHKDEAWNFLQYLYNTPSTKDEGLTIMGSFCKAAGGMLFTHDFVDYARKNYEPIMQPFLDALEHCKSEPLDPQWQTLNNLFVQAYVQQMDMGQISPKDGLYFLHTQLEKLHGN